MLLRELLDNSNLNPTDYYLVIDNGCCGDEWFNITGYYPDTSEIELDNERLPLWDKFLDSEVQLLKSPAQHLAETFGWEVVLK